MILNAPALFGAAKGTAWTDLPRESLPALVELFGRASTAKVKQLRIVPPRYPTWLTAAWVNQIRDDVAALLPGTPAPAAHRRPAARRDAAADAQAHAAADGPAEPRADRRAHRGADAGAHAAAARPHGGALTRAVAARRQTQMLSCSA